MSWNVSGKRPNNSAATTCMFTARETASRWTNPSSSPETLPAVSAHSCARSRAPTTAIWFSSWRSTSPRRGARKRAPQTARRPEGTLRTEPAAQHLPRNRHAQRKRRHRDRNRDQHGLPAPGLHPRLHHEIRLRALAGVSGRRMGRPRLCASCEKPRTPSAAAERGLVPAAFARRHLGWDLYRNARLRPRLLAERSRSGSI